MCPVCKVRGDTTIKGSPKATRQSGEHARNDEIDEHISSYIDADEPGPVTIISYRSQGITKRRVRNKPHGDHSRSHYHQGEIVVGMDVFQ